MNQIEQYLKKMGLTVADTSAKSDMETWKAWYKGKVSSFHNYSVYNGIKRIGRERASLGMAARVCEDWADLLLNEKVKISTPNEVFNAKLSEVLDSNGFYALANKLVELTFAYGTGAFVAYLSASGDVVIDYIKADMIYPITVNGGRVVECAFASSVVVDGKDAYYLQLHLLTDRGYVLRNVYLNAKTGAEIHTPEGVAEEIETGLKTPLFAIIKPNKTNRRKVDSPYGVSCFAGAIDQLKAVDLVYDSMLNEFNLGKKRIFVPLSMARMQGSADTGLTPVFDNKDVVFHAVPENADSANKITESDMKLRVAEHTQGLGEALKLLSLACGLGADRYSFDSSKGLQTATAVISEKSELYQSKSKHELVLRVALKDLVIAIGALLGIDVKAHEVNVDFDDSIIVDKESERAKRMQEVTAGIISKEEYLSREYGVSPDEAASMLPDTSKELDIKE